VAVTIFQYNHTNRLILGGTLQATDTLRVILCTAATFNAANTTLASVTKTEVANGNGYTTGGQALTGVAITTVETNQAMLDASDASWTATGGSIEASFGLVVNDSEAGDPPLWFIDFGGNQVAEAGTDFKVIWPVTGIARLALKVA
jgi:hypothetical protein